MHTHSHRPDFLTYIDRLARSSRLNPLCTEVKAGFALSLLLLCVWADTPLCSMLCVLLPLALLLCWGGTRPSDILRVMALPLAFLLLGSVAVAFTLSPTPIGRLSLPLFSHYLCLTGEEMRQALLLLIKSYGAVCSLFFLSLTTSLDELIALMRRLRVPAVLIDLMFLTYRYIFLLANSYRQMTISSQARLSDCSRHARRRSFPILCASLLAGSYRRTSSCLDAMLSRGYDGSVAFLTPQKEPKPAQIALFSLLFLLVAIPTLALKAGVL